MFSARRRKECCDTDALRVEDLVGVNLCTSVYYGSRKDDILVGVNRSTSMYYGTKKAHSAGGA